MRTFLKATAILTVAVVVTVAPAYAQNPGGGAPLHVSDAHRSSFFDLHPELTKQEFEQFTSELGSVLHFRQLGDTRALGRGKVEIGVQLADTLIDDSKASWNNTMSHPTANDHVGRFMSFPRLVARFGVSDRVDLGVSGGFAPYANYGVAGVDTRIALLAEGPTRPVSVSVRPSMTFLIAPSEVIVGNAGIDLTVSRAFGRLSPYAGVAASSSGAIERSNTVDLDPVSANNTLSYAGLSYRWRTLVVSAQVEKGARVRYAFALGTRF